MTWRHKVGVEGGLDSAEPITMIHTISPDAEAVAGGTESWIRDFLEFASLRYRILGVTFRRDSAGQQSRILAGVEWRVIARIPRQRRFVPHVLRLIIGIIRNRSSITRLVILHRVELAPVVRFLSPASEIVLVVHTNLHSQLASGSDSIWRFFKFLYYPFETFALRSANRVITHASLDAPRLMQGRGAISVVPGWYNDSHFGIQPSPTSRRGVLWVGRFERVKDPLLAVRALSEPLLRSLGPFTFIGSGSMESEIALTAKERGLAHNFRMVGPLEQRALSESMLEHSVLLHTSHFEGSSRVLLEGLASGLKIVTLPECDPDRWVEKTGSGIYAGSRDPKTIAAAVLAAMDLPATKVSDLIAARSATNVIQKLEQIIVGVPQGP